MKAMVCELCGGTDIIKQEGFFVCQHCGVKYAPDEAKQLFIEATVKIDNSARAQNAITIGLREKENYNFAKAAEYFESALLDDPNNWVAYFNAGFCNLAAHDNLHDVAFSLTQFNKRINATIALLGESYSKEERCGALTQICQDCVWLSRGMLKTIESLQRQKIRATSDSQEISRINTWAKASGDATAQFDFRITTLMKANNIVLPNNAKLGDTTEEQIDNILKKWLQTNIISRKVKNEIRNKTDSWTFYPFF